jgi:hypothetical protein
MSKLLIASNYVIVDFQYIGLAGKREHVKEFAIKPYDGQCEHGIIRTNSKLVNQAAFKHQYKLHGLEVDEGESFTKFLQKFVAVFGRHPLEVVVYAHGNNKLVTFNNLFQRYIGPNPPLMVNLEHQDVGGYRNLIGSPDSMLFASCDPSREKHTIRCSKKNVKVIEARLLRQLSTQQ